MNFNAIEFLIIFLPITWLCFRCVKANLRLKVLLFASIVFYAFSGLIPLLFMLIAIFIGFIAAILSKKTHKWLTITLAILPPLVILFLFKYLNFTLENFNAGEETRDFFYFFLAVTLPAGISFYTFQIISYNIDVNEKRIKPENNLIKLATYISLFPQLIARPIVRYNEIVRQLKRISSNQKENVLRIFTIFEKYFEKKSARIIDNII